MGVIDKYRFEHRGGHGCSNSDYVLHRTTCCGSFCVEDNELLDLYIDPADLGKATQLYNESPCPFCDSVDWNLSEITELSGVPHDWCWATMDR